MCSPWRIYVLRQNLSTLPLCGVLRLYYKRRNCTMKNNRCHLTDVNFSGDIHHIFSDLVLFLHRNRNLMKSSRNGKPKRVPTMEPTTPVVRATPPDKPRKLTASISTIWADRVFRLSSPVSL